MATDNHLVADPSERSHDCRRQLVFSFRLEVLLYCTIACTLLTWHGTSSIAAKLAIEYGSAGIIVSNHGARQLDYVPATISCLEEVP
jgi:hypothetical protein